MHLIRVATQFSINGNFPVRIIILKTHARSYYVTEDTERFI